MIVDTPLLLRAFEGLENRASAGCCDKVVSKSRAFCSCFPVNRMKKYNVDSQRIWTQKTTEGYN